MDFEWIRSMIASAIFAIVIGYIIYWVVDLILW